MEVDCNCDQVNQLYLQNSIICFRQDLERNTEDIFVSYDDLSKKGALQLLNKNDYAQLITQLQNYNSKDFVLKWLNRFVTDIKSIKLSFSLDLYSSIIVLYGKWKDYEKLENVFVEICQKNILCNVDTYNNFIHIFANIGNLRCIFQLLQDMKSKSIQPNLTTYNTILLAYVRNKKISDALSLLCEMEKEGLRPDVVTFNNIINGFIKIRDLKSVIKCLETMSSMGVRPNVRTFNTLMSGYSDLGDYEHVEKLYSKMIKMKIQPGIDTYFTLMSAYIRSGKKQRALEIKDHLSNWKSLRLYNMLIHLYIKFNDFSMARLLFDQMSESEFKPNVVTFNTFINGYVNQKDLKEARKYFDEMVKRRISPNVEVYNTLLKGYLNIYGMSAVKKIFSQMSNHDIAPDAVTYNTLMQYIKKQNRIDDYERAIDQYRTMIKKSIVPSDRTFNILLNSVIMRDIRKSRLHYRRLAKYKGTEESMELSLILNEMSSKGYIIDVVTYSILMKNFVHYKKMEEAEKLLQQMKNNVINPNQYIFNIMIYGYCKSYNMNMAQQVVTKMINSGFRKDLKTYTSLINGYVAIGEIREAQREFEEMKQSGLIPDNFVYTSLIDMFANKKNTRNAQKVFDYMRTQGIPMDKKTFTVLMKAYVLDGNIKGACSIYNEMIKEGCEPDEVVIITMLSAYKKGKNIEGVIDLLKDSKINIYLNTQNCNILLNMLAQDKDLSGGAYKLFMKMLESHDQSTSSRVKTSLIHLSNARYPLPDLDSLQIILKRFSYNQRWDLIMLIWDAIDQREINPLIEDFIIFMKAFAKARNEEKLTRVCEKFLTQDPPYYLISQMRQILLNYGISYGLINEIFKK
ncbi:hypothetical protein RclHR1_02620010 [Rhizophagus clarus]|uniref:Pentacotripeptide-repeat region of PRORP domain-containing protein n=1 Tax=Rhizophagus clarus TaxID=94130 RepID=A0A2Z6RE14_9GLOM|nr:hypothetical protein RclHR1_02620010 [Rhizophagus clarus]